MEERHENKLNNWIDKSGNSDVDLIVNIETKSIAYSILCSLYAKGEINESELEKAVEKLDSLMERDRKKQRERDNILDFESRQRDVQRRMHRRSWI